MSKRKVNPLTNGLGSSETEGQGTTTKETGRKKADSSRKKQNKNVLNRYSSNRY